MSLLSATVRALRDIANGLVASQSESPLLSPIDIQWAERGDSLSTERDNRYQFFQWYYDGFQRDPTDPDFGNPPVPTTQPTFASRHNFCAVVVDVMVERLAVEAFTVNRADDAATPEPDQADDEQLAAVSRQLWSWWQQNRMDETQLTVHAQALIKGDSYVFVDWDNDRNRPRLTFNDALATEGSGQTVTPVYDAQHQLDAVYKTWVERYVDASNNIRLRQRITKYTDDTVAKFARDGFGGTWRVWTEDLDADGNPDGGIIPWVDQQGQPLGIPIFHFRNKPRGSDFGRSELDDLIPAQDSYNDRHRAADDAFAYAGGPQKFVTNVVPPASGFITGPDQVWVLNPIASDKPVTAGQFTAGNVAEMQSGVDLQLKTIAALSRTPMYIIWPEGGLPSGESLKTAESGLVAKCTDRSIGFGNTWENAMRFCVRLHNTFGKGDPIDESLIISTQWAPFASRSELSDAQTTAIIGADLSSKERLRRAGYNDQDIERIQAEKEADTPPALALADQFARQTDTGSGQQQMPMMMQQANDANAG